MAPTEILAEQHFINIRRLLESSRFRIALLTGTTAAKKRREMQAELAGGSLHLVVGTHALVEDPVAFRELGLAIIDEQHRFGVMQRAALRAKGMHPDILVMTATPIPRTLALTTYGDLDVSVMREMPPGRKPIKTIAKPESRRDEIYAFIQQAARRRAAGLRHLSAGRRVDQGRSAGGDGDGRSSAAGCLSCVSRRAAARPHEAGRQGPRDGGVRARRVPHPGLDDRRRSRRRRAERVGDGGRARRALRPVAAPPAARPRRPRRRISRTASCCIRRRSTSSGRERLKALTDTTDGFVIAERDLELRGPGDFFGTRQSGMPTLRVGDLLRDHQMMEEARREAVARARRPPARTRSPRSCARAGSNVSAWSESGSMGWNRTYRFVPATSSVCNTAVRMRIIAGDSQGPAPGHTRLAGTAADVGQAARDAVQCARAEYAGRALSSMAMPAPARSASKR